MPAPCPTGTPQVLWPGQRSPVPGPSHPPHQHRLTDRATTNPPLIRCPPTITNAEVETTQHICQQMIAAYHKSDPITGGTRIKPLITKLTHIIPACLTEAATLERTLKKWAVDILTFFDHPNTNNGPIEAVSGRLEHLRGSALGSLDLTHYITRALLETGGFRPVLHPRL